LVSFKKSNTFKISERGKKKEDDGKEHGDGEKKNEKK
jgi:hypothetical protein